MFSTGRQLHDAMFSRVPTFAGEISYASLDPLKVFGKKSFSDSDFEVLVDLDKRKTRKSAGGNLADYKRAYSAPFKINKKTKEKLVACCEKGYCAHGIPPMEIIQAKLLLEEARRNPSLKFRGTDRFTYEEDDMKKFEPVVSLNVNVKEEPVQEDEQPYFLEWGIADQTDGQTEQPVTEISTNENKRKGLRGKRKKPRYICDVCGAKYRKRTYMIAHWSRRHKKFWECKMCEISFTSASEYSEHKRTKKEYHRTVEKACKICGKYVLMIKLSIHMANNHGETKKKKYNYDSVNNICPICGKNIGKVSIKYHCSLHHGKERFVECKICGKKIKKLSVNSHVKLHEEKKHLCTVCGEAFTWKRSLLLHMTRHGQDMPYKCTLCTRQCYNQYDLDRHMKTHEGLKLFQCELCPSNFSAQSSLRRHLEWKHENLQRWVCTMCSKPFPDKFALQKHSRVHSNRVGEIEHTCSLCGKQFFTNKELVLHLKVHAVSKFECSQCCLGFDTQVALQSHFKSNSHLLLSSGQL